MDIYFVKKDLSKVCSCDREMKRRWQVSVAKALQRRLAQLKAANTLFDMATLPGAECHELKGNRQGQLAVNLPGGFRLVFVPYHDPVPTRRDGGIDWAGVTAICVLEVVNYHDG